MKRILPLAIAPVVAALGACSGGSGSKQQPLSSDAGRDDGAIGLDGASGADAGDDGGNPTTQYEADLSGAQVAPAPVGTTATGKAVFTLSPDGTTLAYAITFSPPSFSPTAVDLHLGSVGDDAPVTHPLMPAGNPMRGQVALTIDEQSAIGAAGLYVDAQTQSHPGGEIRGQIVLPGSEIFVATPTGAQQVPSVTSAYTARASFVMTPDQGNLVYHVVTDATPTDLQLHRGIGGTNGPVAYDLPLGGGSPVDGSIPIGGGAGNSDPMDLENGRFYLEIVTQQNPAGELRGQLTRPGEMLLSGVLSGTNEVPPVASQATGGAQMIVSADGSTARYEAVVNGIIPVAVEADAAPAGQSGPVVEPLTLDPTGAFGSFQPSADTLKTLLAGGVYVNVKTQSYPTGELRAQLLTR